MNMDKAKFSLAIVWIAAAALMFVVLIVQTARKIYDPHAEAVWGWFLPTVMPTLSLVIAVLVADSIGKRSHVAKSAHKPMFWLTFAVSAFYLAIVAFSILFLPVFHERPIELMQQSNLWVGPLQGLAVGLLGAFFRSG